VSPVKYEVGLYILDDAILYSHRSEGLKSYEVSNLTCSRLPRKHVWPLNLDVCILIMTVYRPQDVCQVPIPL
jgi:hypothetical protein